MSLPRRFLRSLGALLLCWTTVALPARQADPPQPLPDFRKLVKQNEPAVVNISTTQAPSRKTATRTPILPELPGAENPYLEFFKRFFQERPELPGERQANSLGSGFILSPDGYILTNAHVARDADKIIVRLSDQRERPAKVIGVDELTDVALLKIEGENLSAVKLGDSDALEVGEWVLAIGSPFGFESSASAGIVSANSRNLPDGSYVPFIQTDVAVNPGNSGGPLFNMAGEVIGINSQIYSRSGGYQGLSFAIPIDAAMKVQQQLVTGGKVQRGRLGVAIQEVNQSLADSFGLKKPAGALVSSVEKDSPAAKAGLEPGDVILGINGKSIASSGELPAVVAGMAAGETAKLQVWRAGASREIDVKVGVFADEKIASNDAPQAAKGRLGVVVRPLNPGEQRGSDGGVVVQDVAGAAAKAGIKAGDIVLSVNGEKITGTEQLRELVSKAGKRIAVLVERGESRIFIPVELG